MICGRNRGPLNVVRGAVVGVASVGAWVVPAQSKYETQVWPDVAKGKDRWCHEHRVKPELPQPSQLCGTGEGLPVSPATSRGTTLPFPDPTVGNEGANFSSVHLDNRKLGQQFGDSAIGVAAGARGVQRFDAINSNSQDVRRRLIVAGNRGQAPEFACLPLPVDSLGLLRSSSR